MGSELCRGSVQRKSARSVRTKTIVLARVGLLSTIRIFTKRLAIDNTKAALHHTAPNHMGILRLRLLPTQEQSGTLYQEASLC